MCRIKSKTIVTIITTMMMIIILALASCGDSGGGGNGNGNGSDPAFGLPTTAGLYEGAPGSLYPTDTAISDVTANDVEEAIAYINNNNTDKTYTLLLSAATINTGDLWMKKANIKLSIIGIGAVPSVIKYTGDFTLAGEMGVLFFDVEPGTGNPTGPWDLTIGNKVTLSGQGNTHYSSLVFLGGSTLTMQSGATITGAITGSNAVEISNGSTFIMNGGSIICATVGVHEGTFTMNAGEISGITAGAALYLNGSTSAFTMNGGKIINVAPGNAAVYIGDNASFTMNNGEISDVPQAVNISDGATFTMAGGKISDAGEFAVYVNNGAFIMAGGEISGMTDGGGAVAIYYGNFTMNAGSIINNDFGVSLGTSGTHAINGGSITNNTYGDLDTGSSNLTLSGTADIGNLALNYIGSGDAPFVKIASTWTGSIESISLRYGVTMANVKIFWENKQILTNEAGNNNPPSGATARVGLGNFIDGWGNPELISDTYYIHTTTGVLTAN